MEPLHSLIIEFVVFHSNNEIPICRIRMHHFVIDEMDEINIIKDKKNNIYEKDQLVSSVKDNKNTKLL